jgi:hypothetical protein
MNRAETQRRREVDPASNRVITRPSPNSTRVSVTAPSVEAHLVARLARLPGAERAPKQVAPLRPDLVPSGR